MRKRPTTININGHRLYVSCSKEGELILALPGDLTRIDISKLTPAQRLRAENKLIPKQEEV